MADEHRWEFQRLAGDLSLLKKLFTSDCSDDEIVFVPAGHETVYSAVENCLGSTSGKEGSDERIFGTRQIVINGPRRVAPLLGWAQAKVKGGIDNALASIAVRSVQRQEQIILVALDGTFNFTPTPVEEKIYNLLRDSPKTSEQLARRFDIISPRLLRLERLEQFGLVQRCGPTPTELLHIKNLFNRWSAAPAHRMLDILALALKKNVEQLTEKLLHLINYKLCLELVKKQSL